MKLFVYPFAPNALRVQILAAEKAIALDVVDASMDRAGYGAINPFGQVPSLVLDDGRVITESLTIAHHLDAVSGAPLLFGDDADAAIEIAMWERRGEMLLFNPAIEYGHHVHPMFAAFMAQFPEFARSLRPRIATAAGHFADRLARTPFLAGDHFSAADITAGLGLLLADGYGMVRAADWPPLQTWMDALMARPAWAGARPFQMWFQAMPAPRFD